MLTYLKLAGVFDGVRGLVFGQIERVAADRHLSYSMPEVILDVLGDLDMPILYGFPAGHCQQPLTLPLGVRVAIQQERLVLCEAPVVRPAPQEEGRDLGRR
jgi:muramoyltetrapeptide carboxypeptidase